MGVMSLAGHTLSSSRRSCRDRRGMGGLCFSPFFFFFFFFLVYTQHRIGSGLGGKLSSAFFVWKKLFVVVVSIESVCWSHDGG